MALGATHWGIREDVRRVVNAVLWRLPTTTWNTYHDHPWPGWDARSVDFWGAGGRGDPLPRQSGPTILKIVFAWSGSVPIRHVIYRHRLWTSWGGWQVWRPSDHAGEERHIHVTFW